LRDSSPSTDATLLDSSTRDAADSAATEAAVCPPAGYSALDDSSKWSTFDISTAVSDARGFFGGAFDLHHVYFAWRFGVVRYDSSGALTDPGSWESNGFNMFTAPGELVASAAFDGQNIYFAANYINGGFYTGSVSRYDPSSSFTSTKSWATFEVTTVNTSAGGFSGAAFDGRYLYFVPNRNPGSYDGNVARYDTTAPFAGVGSWATFDVSTVNAVAKGFHGAAFDGRYLYLVPGTDLSLIANPNTVVPRYDTTSDFTSPTSWTTFDLTTANPGIAGGSYAGAAFDGRYVYLVPFNNGGSAYSVVMRFDSTSTFGNSASWSTFDVSRVNPGAKGFQGAAFDGRYIYLVPSISPPGYSGIVTRYDTTVAFESSASWDAFDLTTVNPGAKGFEGAVFDGRYVYLVPGFNGMSPDVDGSDGIVARFDAKMPACLPTGWNASFF